MKVASDTHAHTSKASALSEFYSNRTVEHKRSVYLSALSQAKDEQRQVSARARSMRKA